MGRYRFSLRCHRIRWDVFEFRRIFGWNFAKKFSKIRSDVIKFDEMSPKFYETSSKFDHIPSKRGRNSPNFSAKFRWDVIEFNYI